MENSVETMWGRGIFSVRADGFGGRCLLAGREDRMRAPLSEVSKVCTSASCVSVAPCPFLSVPESWVVSKLRRAFFTHAEVSYQSAVDVAGIWGWPSWSLFEKCICFC